MMELLNIREVEILKTLEAAGYEAYFVGGCVRDAIMGKTRGDIDITTNATPEQIKESLSCFKCIDTGIKHGTITVVIDSKLKILAEVTTYRTEGKYDDGRHPSYVEFVSSVKEDLSRRDFTMNAIAYSLSGEIEDPYGGKEDIKKGIIRCVGESSLRFKEDALRIMRALRFASVLGFEIESETEKAMEENKRLLENISAERKYEEFKKLVAGRYAGNVVRKYVDILGVVVPELLDMKGFKQNNPYHKYDVLEHCIKAMEYIKTTEDNKTYMKMAALFHDVGKPETYFEDDKGIGHFYGHPKKGEDAVRRILKRFKADRETTEKIATLVSRHDLILEREKSHIKKWMGKLGADTMKELLEIKLADNRATGNISEDLSKKFIDIRRLMEEITEEKQCFSLEDLAVNGDDVIAAGIAPGPEVGQVLNDVLNAVIEEKLPNEREQLLNFIYRF